MKILVVNDDGVPHPQISHVIQEFAASLAREPWVSQVSVVLPNCNKSWIGKALQPVDGPVPVSYFHPDTASIHEARTSDSDWILLGASPAACVNIALSHLYPDVDLVISGPNPGRNAGQPSILSSGTVGAALEASFCGGSCVLMLGKKAVALSFAYFGRESLFDPALVTKAIQTSLHIVPQLYRSWASLDGTEAQPALYNVNIPMLDTDYHSICFTPMDKGGYRCLYQPHPSGLEFHFKPSFTTSEAEEGSDLWAIFNRRISITPLYSSLRSFPDLSMFSELVNLQHSPFTESPFAEPSTSNSVVNKSG
ncbi:hypothetical protein HDU91_006115 [Kappamyces sp. JEL0680]|nr:hypothetical protein HDU91_006115 [Kappamyces sp. JEL0680]